MSILLGAVLPIFALILLGFFLKKWAIHNTDFWHTCDTLTYYLFMPALLFHKIASGNFSHSGSDSLKGVWVVALTMLTLTALAILTYRIIHIQAARFTSFYQGAIRYNTYIFLAVVDQVYGTESMVFAAFLIALIVPLINILCVSIFAIYIRNGRFSLTKTIKTILTNPLILACALGGLCNILHIDGILLHISSLLGSAAITLGLLSIGAGLKPKSLPYRDWAFWLSIFFKLLLFPIFVLIWAYFFRLPELYLAVCLIFAAMPTASSSYILAGQMGGDTDLMSMIITAQTLICSLSIWTVLMILQVA